MVLHRPIKELKLQCCAALRGHAHAAAYIPRGDQSLTGEECVPFILRAISASFLLCSSTHVPCTQHMTHHISLGLTAACAVCPCEKFALHFKSLSKYCSLSSVVGSLRRNLLLTQ